MCTVSVRNASISCGREWVATVGLAYRLIKIHHRLVRERLLPFFRNFVSIEFMTRVIWLCSFFIVEICIHFKR